MLENTMLFMTIALFIILTVGFVGYMRGRVDSRDYVFHKIWYLFMYASLKTEILIGTGIAALESLFKNERKETFSKYSMGSSRMDDVHRKEQKLREMKEIHGKGSVHKNLKILK